MGGHEWFMERYRNGRKRSILGKRGTAEEREKKFGRQAKYEKKVSDKAQRRSSRFKSKQ